MLILSLAELSVKARVNYKLWPNNFAFDKQLPLKILILWQTEEGYIPSVLSGPLVIKREGK